MEGTALTYRTAKQTINKNILLFNMIHPPQNVEIEILSRRHSFNHSVPFCYHANSLNFKPANPRPRMPSIKALGIEVKMYD